jgi:glutathione S-transferase
MITVFGGWPTRAIRVIWLLEEMDLPYEQRPVDLFRRREDAEFISVNPAGFLPAMRDGDVTMVESIAIMEYLIARYGPAGMAPAATEASYPYYKQFLLLGEAGMAAYLNIVVASRFFAPDPDKDNWGARQAVQMFQNRLTLVSKRLDEVPHVAGKAFTAADISVCYALGLGARLGIGDQYTPAIKSYLERLMARDYKRAMKKSGAPAADPS